MVSPVGMIACLNYGELTLQNCLLFYRFPFTAGFKEIKQEMGLPLRFKSIMHLSSFNLRIKLNCKILKIVTDPLQKFLCRILRARV
jgi:hypothetical protein